MINLTSRRSFAIDLPKIATFYRAACVDQQVLFAEVAAILPAAEGCTPGLVGLTTAVVETVAKAVEVRVR